MTNTLYFFKWEIIFSYMKILLIIAYLLRLKRIYGPWWLNLDLIWFFHIVDFEINFTYREESRKTFDLQLYLQT